MKRRQHPRMNREIIDALLRLFDERVTVDFPPQLLRFATDFSSAW